MIWKNTSIKRIGAKIAARYGLAFTYDADDYDIECDEQDGTDSSYYNSLCKNYGLILKVYARRLWVYDREKYKAKRAVRTFDRSQIRPGSFGYTTTLSGTYTGGYFNYTDADKDIDIECSVGGGSHTKSVNRRATSVYDASVQLCAELNSANHGTVKLRFGVDGDWRVSAGNCIALTGFGNLNGKYFVDKVTHKVSSNGLTTDFECSGIGPTFHSWDVGGKIVYHEKTADSGIIQLGNNVKMGYYSQEQERLHPELSVLDEVRDTFNFGEKEARNILGMFLFRGDDVFKQVAMLSGGEKARLSLLCLFLEKPNFLILDEPTSRMTAIS